MEQVFRMTVKVGKVCETCRRKLDTRMVGNPYGSWSIPIVDGATGRTLCGYCHNLEKGWDALTQLPADCESLKQLGRWLARKPTK